MMDSVYIFRYAVSAATEFFSIFFRTMYTAATSTTAPAATATHAMTIPTIELVLSELPCEFEVTSLLARAAVVEGGYVVGSLIRGPRTFVPVATPSAKATFEGRACAEEFASELCCALEKILCGCAEFAFAVRYVTYWFFAVPH